MTRLMTRSNVQLAAYALFIAVIMILPLFTDVFWLNHGSRSANGWQARTECAA